MDAPTISIKIKGLQALDALNNGQLLGGLKVNGANAMLAIRGMDGNRMMMAKKGLLMREMEMEGNRMMLMQQPSQGAANAANTMGATATKSSVAQGAIAAKGGTTAKIAAIAAASKGAGAAMYKGIGWNLWLGGLGPWLVLGSVGMAAMGVYFYLRAQRLMLASGEGDGDFDER
jgi:hypothetical protein